MGPVLQMPGFTLGFFLPSLAVGDVNNDGYLDVVAGGTHPPTTPLPFCWATAGAHFETLPVAFGARVTL